MFLEGEVPVLLRGSPLLTTPSVARRTALPEQLMRQKIQFSEEVIDLRRQDRDAAAALIGGGEGKQVFGKLRAVVRELSGAEQRELGRLRDAATASRNMSADIQRGHPGAPLRGT